jgi:hypothetical protein
MITQKFNGQCWHDMGYFTIDREICLIGDHFRYFGDPEDEWYEEVK